MSIATVVTRGFGIGSIAFVITEGYSIGAGVVAPPAPRLLLPYQIRTSRGYGTSRQSIPVNCSSTGNNVIVEGEAGRRILVLSYIVSAAAPVNAKWRSSGGADLSGVMDLATGRPVGQDHDPDGTVLTGVGEDLQLNLSGAVAVGGHLTYTVMSAT